MLVTHKQWQKLTHTARDPQDLLTVTGFPTINPHFPGITVPTTQTTTKQIQQDAPKATPTGG